MILFIQQMDAGILFLIPSFILAIVAFFYGNIVLIRDAVNKNLKLKNFAANISAVLLALLTLYIIFLGIRVCEGSTVVCGTNLSSLGKTISLYAYDNDDYYPGCNQWCDLLILYADGSPLTYICNGSDDTLGESSYAMNISLEGKKTSDIDPNVVVLFDTNYGKNPD